MDTKVGIRNFSFIFPETSSSNVFDIYLFFI